MDQHGEIPNIGEKIMALIPPFFLDTVVAIGVNDDTSSRRWIGSGFIYGELVVNRTKEKHDKNSYMLWLVTNKHVLKGLRAIHIKFNSANEPDSKDYKVNLIARNGKPYWIGHPDENIDVAVIFISANILRQDSRSFSYFMSDRHIMNKKNLIDNKITEGDSVFVLGFPMGLVSQERQYVICRGGCIARIRDFLDNKSSDYMIDSPVFPGNSGGPVIISPSAYTIQGTKPIKQSCLVGIVKSYIPYKDSAISQQTLQPRIIFEENSGLTAVESVDSIEQTIRIAIKRLNKRMAKTKQK